jgi:Flp pilus assembly pilin Flp
MTTQLPSPSRRDGVQDLIEYGLLGAFVSIVAMVAIRAFGPVVNDIYVAIQGALRM